MLIGVVLLETTLVERDAEQLVVCPCASEVERLALAQEIAFDAQAHSTEAGVKNDQELWVQHGTVGRNQLVCADGQCLPGAFGRFPRYPGLSEVPKLRLYGPKTA